MISDAIIGYNEAGETLEVKVGKARREVARCKPLPGLTTVPRFQIKSSDLAVPFQWHRGRTYPEISNLPNRVQPL